MPTRLITIPFSHYCEKARWALERAGIDIVEDGHLPIFSYLPLLGRSNGRTVPVLTTSSGEVIPDSTDILHWCDRTGNAAPLFPADQPDVAVLEEEFDKQLGPATRRLGYFHLLPSKAAMIDVMSKHVPGWERRVGPLLRPMSVALMRRGLKINEAGAARSTAIIDRIFAAVADRLSDGRRYLCGERFSAADLTFAALTTPILAPDSFASHYLPRSTNMPAGYLALRDHYRNTPAGRFALRLYADDRIPRA
jgi:glutathione S-transferase